MDSKEDCCDVVRQERKNVDRFRAGAVYIRNKMTLSTKKKNTCNSYSTVKNVKKTT